VPLRLGGKYFWFSPNRRLYEPDAALSSFVATKDSVDNLFEIPQMAFAFCYLACHFGLNLVDKNTLSEAMGYIESKLDYLIKITTLD